MVGTQFSKDDMNLEDWTGTTEVDCSACKLYFKFTFGWTELNWSGFVGKNAMTKSLFMLGLFTFLQWSEVVGVVLNSIADREALQLRTG